MMNNNNININNNINNNNNKSTNSPATNALAAYAIYQSKMGFYIMLTIASILLVISFYQLYKYIKFKYNPKSIPVTIDQPKFKNVVFLFIASLVFFLISYGLNKQTNYLIANPTMAALDGSVELAQNALNGQMNMYNNYGNRPNFELVL